MIPPPTRWGRVRARLGLERNVVVLLLALLVVGMGEELWSRFVPKYLELIGGGVWIVAAYGALKDLLDALLPYPGGWLADRLGRRRALTAFALLAAGGYAVYLLSPTWGWFLLGTCLVVAWNSLTLRAVFAVIGDHLPREKRGVGFAVQSLWKRVPVIVAPSLGGGLIAAYGFEVGMKAGFAVSVGLALVAVLIVRRYYVDPPPEPHVPLRVGAVWRGLDGRLKRLLVADVLARWAEGIPKVFVVLYVLDVLRRDPAEFGWLVGLQMFTATVIYLPVAALLGPDRAQAVRPCDLRPVRAVPAGAGPGERVRRARLGVRAGRPAGGGGAGPQGPDPGPDPARLARPVGGPLLPGPGPGRLPGRAGRRVAVDARTGSPLLRRLLDRRRRLGGVRGVWAGGLRTDARGDSRSMTRHGSPVPRRRRPGRGNPPSLAGPGQLLDPPVHR